MEPAEVRACWYWLTPVVALTITVIVGYHAQKLVPEITATLRTSEPARPPGG
jgi:hypothetical protein